MLVLVDRLQLQLSPRSRRVGGVGAYARSLGIPDHFDVVRMQGSSTSTVVEARSLVNEIAFSYDVRRRTPVWSRRHSNYDAFVGHWQPRLASLFRRTSSQRRRRRLSLGEHMTRMQRRLRRRSRYRHADRALDHCGSHRSDVGDGCDRDRCAPKQRQPCRASSRRSLQTAEAGIDDALAELQADNSFSADRMRRGVTPPVRGG